ncbi:Myb-like dna-binding protein, partial [Globisporangium splendens]
MLRIPVEGTKSSLASVATSRQRTSTPPPNCHATKDKNSYEMASNGFRKKGKLQKKTERSLWQEQSKDTADQRVAGHHSESHSAGEWKNNQKDQKSETNTHVDVRHLLQHLGILNARDSHARNAPQRRHFTIARAPPTQSQTQQPPRSPRRSLSADVRVPYKHRMTISKRVQKELFSAAPAGLLPPQQELLAAAAASVASRGKKKQQVKGPKLSKAERARVAAIADENKGKAWTDEEHARFLEALKEYPSGPWKAIADFVGTKNSRQTMTHAQKYRQKHERRTRGLRNRSKQRKVSARAAAAAKAKQAAPPPTTTPSTSAALSARTRSQTMMSVHVNDDVVMASTPEKHVLACTAQSSDSPRSSEEATTDIGITYVSSPLTSVSVATVDAAIVDEDAASWEQLKVSSLSEMFQDFEPMSFLPAMWSTNSLGGDVDAIVMSSYGTNELFSDSASSLNPLSLWG